jgi:hypothetical protein
MQIVKPGRPRVRGGRAAAEAASHRQRVEDSKSFLVFIDLVHCSCISIACIYFTFGKHYFAESSTAFLNAPSRAVS